MTRKIIILLCAAAALVGAYFAGRVYYDRKVPNFKDISEIYIYPDTPVEDVVAQILRESSPRWEGSVRRAFASVGSVKPGHYTIDASCSSTYAARMMALGWQTPINLVFAGSMRTGFMCPPWGVGIDHGQHGEMAGCCGCAATSGHLDKISGLTLEVYIC